MSDKVDLICEYCGVEIGLDDHKCPNCGANCSKIIKKYKDLEKQKTDEKEAKILKTQEDITSTVLKTFKTSSKISYIIFGIVAVAFIFTFVMIGISFFGGEKVVDNPGFGDIDNDKDDIIKVGFNELAVDEDYTIILSDYELYEYRSDNFTNYNTKEGYQKIAFHFTVENKDDDSMFIGGFDKISLTADDYAVEETDLAVNQFCEVVSGKASYDELSNKRINSHSKLQGYVGFEVPIDKKVLKFSFDDVLITMDNPAYEE